LLGINEENQVNLSMAGAPVGVRGTWPPDSGIL